ncbi:hypothetical protein ACKWTF_013327 [Chironomus riparius]
MALNLSRTFCNRALLFNPAVYKAQLSAARCVSLKVVKAPAPLNETHDDRNARFNRPQSPHLTIYAPQLTAMLSITHRGTGFALAGYVAMLGLAGLGCPEGANAVVAGLESLQLGAVTLAGFKFCFAFPFAYHMMNGVRHLFWDTGKFLSIKEVYMTGYAMVLAATVISLALTFMN